MYICLLLSFAILILTSLLNNSCIRKHSQVIGYVLRRLYVSYHHTVSTIIITIDAVTITFSTTVTTFATITISSRRTSQALIVCIRFYVENVADSLLSILHNYPKKYVAGIFRVLHVSITCQ